MGRSLDVSSPSLHGTGRPMLPSTVDVEQVHLRPHSFTPALPDKFLALIRPQA